MLVTTQFEPNFGVANPPYPDVGKPTGSWEEFQNVRDDKALALIIWDGVGSTFTIKVQGRVAKADGTFTQYAIKNGNFDQTYFPDSSTSHSADEGPYNFFARPMQNAAGVDQSKSSMHYYFPKNPQCRVNVTANASDQAGIWSYFIH